MIYTMRKTCRLCGGETFLPVLDLGTQAFSGRFPRPEDPDPPKAPLEIVRCGDPLCGLVQLRHEVDPEELFRDYYYKSSVSATMRTHLAGIAAEACQMLQEREGEVCVAPRFLDIAGNDGCLLNAIPVPTGVRVLIDPSNVRVEYGGISQINGFFPNDLLLTRQFDVVFTIAMFYDSHDPAAFAQAVAKTLMPNGLWCIEVADLAAVLRNVAFDYWVHEHAFLASAHAMTLIARKAGLKIVRAEASSSNGGSVRYYLTQQHSKAYDNHPDWSVALGELWSVGKTLAERSEPYSEFARAAQSARTKLSEFLGRHAKGGHRIHVLGASTKLGTVLQWCDQADKVLINAASDRDPRKVGRVMPGTRIPILSEEASRAAKPDVYLTVLPFQQELIDRERAAGTAADLVSILPELRVFSTVTA